MNNQMPGYFPNQMPFGQNMNMGQGFNNFFPNFRQLEQRVTRLERDVRRLENKVDRLERGMAVPFNDNINSYQTDSYNMM